MMLNRFLLILALISLNACSNKVKDTLGINSSGPDEYSVGTNKPLEMPPHFNLDDIEKPKENKPHSNNTDLNKGQASLLKELEN